MLFDSKNTLASACGNMWIVGAVAAFYAVFLPYKIRKPPEGGFISLN